MLKIIFLLGVLIMATRAEDKDCQWNEWLCEGECIDREQSCNGVCKENMVLCPQSNQNETSCIFQHEACNGSCLSPEASVYLPYSDRCVSECSDNGPLFDSAHYMCEGLCVPAFLPCQGICKSFQFAGKTIDLTGPMWCKDEKYPGKYSRFSIKNYEEWIETKPEVCIIPARLPCNLTCSDPSRPLLREGRREGEYECVASCSSYNEYICDGMCISGYDLEKHDCKYLCDGKTQWTCVGEDAGKCLNKSEPCGDFCATDSPRREESDRLLLEGKCYKKFELTLDQQTQAIKERADRINKDN